MTDTLTIEITHDEREAIWAGLNLYIDAVCLIPANRDSEAVKAARALFVKVSNAQWVSPVETPYQPGRLEELLAEIERLQGAINTAYVALRASAYVGGPSEREAWRTAVDALGEVATQHKGQDAQLVPGNDRESGDAA
jgi:hypothetical protein